MAEKFSLKDALFNQQKVEMISLSIKSIYPEFEQENFEQEVLGKFPRLELKERIYHMSNCFGAYLPKDYVTAANILLKSLPLELDSSKCDDDFGDFIYAPYGDFITKYGLSKKDLDFSFYALREITKRFSVEYAIRDFINIYPTETLEMLLLCSKSENYHERRLASEGLRPKLPWAKKLVIDYQAPIEHLSLLFTDKTRYVTRSVANHLNDISKIDAPLVVKTLMRWKESQKQEEKEMTYITNHALRTLVKQGDEKALELLGYNKNPPIILKNIKLDNEQLRVGETLSFHVSIEATEETQLMIDYIIYFQTKAGTLTSKVHKLKKLSLKKGEMITLHKKHPFRANMSTRTFYEGEHKVALQINGTIMQEEIFFLSY